MEIEGEERRRTQKGPLARYNAGRVKHRKQLAFHKCKKRNRWVFGGNRSRKTECGAVECVYLARGVHPYRKNKDGVFGWVVSLSQQVQRDVAQKKILHYLDPAWIDDIVMLAGKKGTPGAGIIDQIRVRNVFGGISVIGFKSCDQGREKFQGSSLDFVWFDEEPPRDIYEECRMRVFDRRGELFGTMTPLKGRTFLFDEIYMNGRQDPEVWYEFMEWADNPFLDKKEIARLGAALGERELESRRFGRFCVEEGLVYPEFDERVHVISPFSVPFEWQDTISIDPGLNNPLSAHWYCTDFDGNVYIVAEHYEAKRDIDYHSMVQRSKDTELYKLLDIYLFIKKGYIELSGLYNKVKKYGLEQPVYSVMCSISELFSDFHFSDYVSMFRPKDGADEVIDPPTGRKFVWEKPLSERINFFDKECFLREVKDE